MPTSSSFATSAWPASCTAIRWRSAGFIAAWPAALPPPISCCSSTRSKCSCVTAAASSFAASSAAALTALAIAAGESPVESRASCRKSVSPAVRSRAAYSANSASRSSTLGSARLQMRSKRPGRIIAGSRLPHVVGGAHDHDARGGREAVELHEQRVDDAVVLGLGGRAAPERLPRPSISSMNTTHGACRRASSKSFFTRRTPDAEEHVAEVAAGERDERHAGLARHRAREQRLAGAGVAFEHDALGRLRAQLGELRGLPEIGDDVLERILGVLDADHVARSA